MAAGSKGVQQIMENIGYHPAKIHHSSTIESILHFVNSGCGMTILPVDSNMDSRYPRLRSVSIIQPDSKLTLYISFNRKRNHVLTTRFMEKARLA